MSMVPGINSYMDELLTTDNSLPMTVTGITHAFPGAEGPFGRMVYRKEAAKFLGVKPRTLIRYEELGLIKAHKNVVNGRVHYVDTELLALLGSRLNQSRGVVLYCRSAVLGSKHNPNNDVHARLEEQVNLMVSYCSKAGIRVDEVIKDVGPGTGQVGLPGLDRLMELVIRKKVSMVVVETPDRLARWGMGHILERFLAWHGVELHIACPALARKDLVEELKQDLTEIIYESKRLLGEL